MKKCSFLILFLLSAFSLRAEDSRYRSLLESYRDLGRKGDFQKGEIELVLDPKKISEIERLQKERWLRKGFLEEQAASFSKVGVIAEDGYWLWIRDAVIFPNGAFGTYNRVLWKNSLDGPTGVAILPMDEKERVFLVLHYRHATRSWELELPRGSREKGETAEMAALRELKEETGLHSSECQFLGEVAPDTGTLSSVVPVFLVRVAPEGKLSHQQLSEGISGVYAFSYEEMIEGLRKGSIRIGELEAGVRDSFLAFALLQHEIRKER